MAAPPDISFQLRNEPGFGMAQVIVRIVSDRPIFGRYQLRFEKRGRSGSANLSQGGNLRLLPGVPRFLNGLRTSIYPNDHYNITLELSEYGRLIARENYPPRDRQ